MFPDDGRTFCPWDVRREYVAPNIGIIAIIFLSRFLYSSQLSPHLLFPFWCVLVVYFRSRVVRSWENPETEDGKDEAQWASLLLSLDGSNEQMVEGADSGGSRTSRQRLKDVATSFDDAVRAFEFMLMIMPSCLPFCLSFCLY
jgi:hypothetical protein